MWDSRYCALCRARHRAHARRNFESGHDGNVRPTNSRRETGGAERILRRRTSLFVTFSLAVLLSRHRRDPGTGPSSGYPRGVRCPKIGGFLRKSEECQGVHRCDAQILGMSRGCMASVAGTSRAWQIHHERRDLRTAAPDRDFEASSFTRTRCTPFGCVLRSMAFRCKRPAHSWLRERGFGTVVDDRRGHGLRP
jgi:hypothetical protein